MSTSIHGERTIFSMSLRTEKSFDRVAQGLFGLERPSHHAFTAADGSQTQAAVSRHSSAVNSASSTMSMRTRALARPQTRKSAWQLPPRYDGELFGALSSFGRDFAVSIKPEPKRFDVTDRLETEYERRAALKIAYDDAATAPAPRCAYEFQAPKQYGRYDRPPCSAIMVPTRWHGTRNVFHKGFTVKGKEYPDEKSEVALPGFRTTAPIQDRLRPRPSSSPVGSEKLASAPPPPYGTWRLAKTPTSTSLISLRERVWEEQVKQKRKKMNLGRRMHSDERLAFFTVESS